jgi:AcrR family transcriptional regulator
MSDIKSTPTETRAQAQRERILAAAAKCFIEHGFHAASMANIADAAQMSPGLIYRYFGSKNEIIVAIIDQQLQLAREDISQINGATDFALEISQAYGQSHTNPGQRMNPALFLEISAEASRDPKVAAAVRLSDQTLDAEFRRRLGLSREEGGFGLPAPRAQAVTLLLECLWAGLRVHETRQPDLDRTVLHAALQEFFSVLLPTDTPATR